MRKASGVTIDTSWSPSSVLGILASMSGGMPVPCVHHVPVSVVGRCELGRASKRNSNTHTTPPQPSPSPLTHLDGRPARRLVLGHRHDEALPVREPEDALHEPLAEGRLSHEHRAAVVPQRRRQDLRGAGGAAVRPDDERVGLLGWVGGVGWLVGVRGGWVSFMYME